MSKLADVDKMLQELSLYISRELNKIAVNASVAIDEAWEDGYKNGRKDEKAKEPETSK